jgi:chromosome segregation ATPase
MKFTPPKFTPRTIVLISVGILAYIALAGYYSNVKKKNPLPEPQPLMSHEQSETDRLQQHITTGKQEIAAAREEEARLSKELSRQSEQKDTVSSDNQKRLKQMQQELANREQQLSTLLQGKEIIAKKFQEMQGKLAHSEATAAGLKKSNQELANELSKSQATVKQLDELRNDLESQDEGLRTANDRILKLVMRLEQSEANLSTAQDTIASLKIGVEKAEQTKSAAEKQANKITAYFDENQAQMQKQLIKTGNLQARLAEATSQIAILKHALKKSDMKADALLHYGQEKDRMLAN